MPGDRGATRPRRRSEQSPSWRGTESALRTAHSHQPPCTAHQPPRTAHRAPRTTPLQWRLALAPARRPPTTLPTLSGPARSLMTRRRRASMLRWGFWPSPSAASRRAHPGIPRCHPPAAQCSPTLRSRRSDSYSRTWLVPHPGLRSQVEFMFGPWSECWTGKPDSLYFSQASEYVGESLRVGA